MNTIVLVRALDPIIQRRAVTYVQVRVPALLITENERERAKFTSFNPSAEIQRSRLNENTTYKDHGDDQSTAVPFTKSTPSYSRVPIILLRVDRKPHLFLQPTPPTPTKVSTCSAHQNRPRALSSSVFGAPQNRQSISPGPICSIHRSQQLRICPGKMCTSKRGSVRSRAYQFGRRLFNGEFVRSSKRIMYSSFVTISQRRASIDCKSPGHIVRDCLPQFRSPLAT